MILKHEGIKLSDIDLIKEKEQNKLDETVKILEEASNRTKNIIFKIFKKYNNQSSRV